MGYTEALETLLAAAPERSGVRSLVRPGAAGLVREDSARSGLLRRRTHVVPPVTGSYVGGHPLQEEGAEWPQDADGWPMHFVLQVNFAEVPPLPDFPTSGLLQMFVRDDPVHGLTFDDTAGTRGMLCRWLDEDVLERPVAVSPDDQVFSSEHTPLADPQHPVALDFVEVPMLPLGWENLEPDVAAAPGAFAALEVLLEEEEDLVEAVEEAVSEDGRWSGVQVGGWPAFVQAAPEVPEGRSRRLLLGLAGGLFEWGDVGTAHLFGDPGRLASGHVEDLWWEWSS